MKLYNILIKRNEDNKVEDVTAIKEGFSYPALFLSGIWFVYHRMWKEIFSLLLINLVLGIFSNSLSNFDKFFFEIAFIVIIAINANYWRGLHLRKNKEYEFCGLTFGKNEEEAKLRFITNNKADFATKIDYKSNNFFTNLLKKNKATV